MSYPWIANDPDRDDDGPDCLACMDVGWLEFEDGLVIPCTECSRELTIDDMEELDAAQA